MKLLHLLKNKFFIFFVKFSCILNLPQVYSFILILSLKKIKNINYKKKISEKKILFFYKSIGINDINSAFNTTPSNYPIYFCESIYILEVFNYFVTTNVKDYDYIKKNSSQGKKKYKIFMKEVFSNLKSSWNLGGFMSSSIFYRQIKEIENLSQEINLPFIVIQKEGIRTKKERKVAEWLIKNRVGKFRGSKLIVYNNDEKKTYIKTDFAPKNKIEVCGCPRFDNYFKLRNKPQKKSIAFFLIQEEYGLPIKNFKWFIPDILKKKLNVKKFNWNFLNEQYVKIIKKFIDENPDYEIILKTKTGYITQQSKYFENLKRKNFKIIKGGDSFAVIKKCRYIVAFNSTVLFEAIAANRILISVKDLVKNKNYNGFILDTKNIHYDSNSLNNLDKLKSKKNLDEKNFILNKYMGNFEGNSSSKVAKSINSHLDFYHSKFKNNN